jgi:MoaA/NifB/PqqE/SkfB family radical SAM enzyme
MQVKNMVRMGTAAVLHGIAGSRRPVNVMLAVTNRCNGSCRYCRIPTRGGRDMSTDEILRLIDEMAAAGTVRLGLWGGEPLLRPDIGAIVDRARARGMYVTMDSNGLLWRDRHADLRTLNHVTFAYDGNRTAHEANRGPGTYDRVREAIDIATRTGGLQVWTLTVLTRHNLQDIDAVIDHAERLGIHCAFQVLHHNGELGCNHDELLPTNEQYRDAFRHLRERKLRGAPIASSLRYFDSMLAWPDFRQTRLVKAPNGVSCRAGSLYCNVDANGDVYACSLMVGEASAKNALESGFRAAFDAIPPLPCASCSATCFTEYNHLYSLDPRCILDWIRTTRR